MYKCVVNTDTNNNNKKTCVEELKPCSEYLTTDGHCVDLKAETGYRCVLYDNKCEAHKDECTDLTENECNSNIPANYKKYCSWDSSKSSCQEVDRACANHIIFQDNGDNKANTGGSIISSCFDLKVTDSEKKTCYLNGNNCEEYFLGCTSGDADNCQSIKPLNSEKNGFKTLYECKYSTSCEEKLIMCENYNGNEINDNICSSLDVEDSTNKICRYDASTSKCKEIYKTCTSINSVEDENAREEGCTNIIPRDESFNIDPYSECYFDDAEGEKKCKSRKKECSKLSEELCNRQVLDNTYKHCLYLDNACKELYKTCDNYNNDVSNTNKVDSDCTESVHSEDPIHYKCFIDDKDNNKCKKILKECKELSKENCNDNHVLEDKNKRCLYIGNSCKEVYQTCDSFNQDKDNTDKTLAQCEEIEPKNDPFSKCVYNNDAEDQDKKCENKPKDCNEIDAKSCNSYINLTKNNMRCFYIGNSCKEIYKTCEDYNNDNENKQRKEDNFREITNPLYDESFIYKCILDEGTCTKKKLICGEDYTGNDENYCTSLNINFVDNDKDKYECKIKEGVCTKVYKSCYKYDGKDATICESIEASDEYHKCIISSNKCSETPKICSDYKGKSSQECSKYKHSAYVEPTETVSYNCVIENNICVDKIIYSNCDAYKGDNKEICELIELDNINKKCVYSSDQGCHQEQRNCEEEKNDIYCFTMTPTNTNKQCLYDYTNKKCVERYKTCDLYASSGDEISKDKCESILIKEASGQFSSTHKCVYDNSGSNPTCTPQEITCSDFNIKKIASQCSMINPNDISKQCIFKNNNCQTKAKTCLEMSSLSGVDENICTNAVASSNKVCVLNEDQNGCEEKEKETEKENENSSNKNNLNIIIFIVFCLLF